MIAPLGGVGRGRAAADLLIQIVSRVFNLALGVVVTVLVARALGDEDLGRWATVAVVVQLAAYFVDLGLENVAVRQAAVEPDRESHWVGALVSLRLLLALPMAAVAAALVVLVAEGEQMRLAGLVLCLSMIVGAPMATRVILQLRVRNDLNMVVTTANSLLWTAAVIVIIVGGGGLVELAIGFVAVAAATTALQVWLATRRGAIRLRGARSRWQPLVRVGLSVGAAGVLTLAYARIDQVIVFELAGARDAGLYSAAYRIHEQAQFIPIAVMTTVFPLLAAAVPTDPARSAAIFGLTVRLLAASSLGLLAVTVSAAEPLVRLLYGAEFAEAADALPILMAAFVVVAFGYVSGHLVLLYDLQRRLVAYALLALVFNVTLNVLLVPRGGFMAAAWITLATEVLVVGLAMRAVMRAGDLRLPWRALLPTIAAAAGTAGLLGVLRDLGLGLGGLLAVAALAYPMLLLASGAVARGEVAELARQARRR